MHNELKEVAIPKDLMTRIEVVTRETVDKFILNLPIMLEKYLTKGVLASLGFKLSWGGELEVDSSNNSKGLVVAAIDNRVRELVNPIITPTIANALEVLATDKKYIASVVKKVVNNYKTQYEHAVDAAARKQAEKMAEKLVAGISKQECIIDVSPDNSDIEDPHGHSGPLNEACLAEVARLIAEGKPCRTVKVERMPGRTIIIETYDPV